MKVDCICTHNEGDTFDCRACYPEGDPRVRNGAYINVLRGIVEAGTEPTPDFTLTTP